MVLMGGLEPPTPRLSDENSNQLNYISKYELPNEQNVILAL